MFFAICPEKSVTQMLLGNANLIRAGGAWLSESSLREHAAQLRGVLAVSRSPPFHEVDLNTFLFNYAVIYPHAPPPCVRVPKERSAAMQHGAFSPYAASSAGGLPAEDR